MLLKYPHQHDVMFEPSSSIERAITNGSIIQIGISTAIACDDNHVCYLKDLPNGDYKRIALTTRVTSVSSEHPWKIYPAFSGVIAPQHGFTYIPSNLLNCRVTAVKRGRDFMKVATMECTP